MIFVAGRFWFFSGDADFSLCFQKLSIQCDGDTVVLPGQRNKTIFICQVIKRFTIAYTKMRRVFYGFLYTKIN